MEIKLTKTGKFPAGEWDNWSIRTAVADGDFLTVTAPDGAVSVACNYTDGKLTVSLRYDWDSRPLTLISTRVKGEFAISATPARVMLLEDGRVMDENWPIGKVCLGEAAYTASVDAVFSDEAIHEGEFIPETVTDIKSWKPFGGDASVGDCMPFADGDTYRLFYLLDRRHHGSKWSLGAHQWAQISTKDFKTWTTHPLAIGIDEQWEGSICTGSMIKVGDTYYGFYSARADDFFRERLKPWKMSWATSKDGVHFTKSGKYFALSDRYDPTTERDPKVYRTDDGVFHLLVTTSLAENNLGCLAHMTSTDLENWTEQDPFYVWDTSDQPECPDFFFYGGRYYLVFAIKGQAHWFCSNSPDGPWEAPEDNVLVGVAVPKCAEIGGRLIFTGFTPNQGYAGNFDLYEATQDENGGLVFTHLTK